MCKNLCFLSYNNANISKLMKFGCHLYVFFSVLVIFFEKKEVLLMKNENKGLYLQAFSKKKAS